MVVSSAPGKWGQETRASWTSQSSLSGELQANERPCFKELDDIPAMTPEIALRLQGCSPIYMHPKPHVFFFLK